MQSMLGNTKFQQAQKLSEVGSGEGYPPAVEANESLYDRDANDVPRLKDGRVLRKLSIKCSGLALTHHQPVLQYSICHSTFYPQGIMDVSITLSLIWFFSEQSLDNNF